MLDGQTHSYTYQSSLPLLCTVGKQLSVTVPWPVVRGLRSEAGSGVPSVGSLETAEQIAASPECVRRLLNFMVTACAYVPTFHLHMNKENIWTSFAPSPRLVYAN